MRPQQFLLWIVDKLSPTSDELPAVVERCERILRRWIQHHAYYWQDTDPEKGANIAAIDPGLVGHLRELAEKRTFLAPFLKLLDVKPPSVESVVAAEAVTTHQILLTAFRNAFVDVLLPSLIG